jgi:hypothetical protein
VFGVVAVAFLAGQASSAIAQPAGSNGTPPVDPVPARSPAEQAFLDGRVLMDAGKHPEACARFEESIKLEPDAPGTLLNLGLCNERMGRTATALAWFRKAQFRAAETAMTDYEDVAKNNTFMLAVRVPTLRIAVTNAPPGSTVHLDDKQLADLELGKVEVDPGRHVVELRIQGKEPVRAEVTVKDGDHRDVPLTIVTAAPPAPVQVTVDVDRGASRRLLAYVVGGAGLAMWGGSLAVSLVARGDYQASEHPEDRRDAQQLARFGGTSLFIAGTAAIAGAVVIYLSAPGVERGERTALTPVVGGDQLGLVVHGAF